MSHSIFATEPIVRHELTAQMLSAAGLMPSERRCVLKGIAEEYTVYEIP